MLYLVVLAGVNVFLVLMTGTVLSLIAGVATAPLGGGNVHPCGRGNHGSLLLLSHPYGSQRLIFIFIKKRHGKVLI